MADIVKKVKDGLTLQNVLKTALRAPLVKIDREKFMRKELIKYYPESVVTEAIMTNPARAGISKDIINTISKTVIDYETKKVTALSVAASIPGGAAAVGAAAVDITSYFTFILRVVQELAYLYGFDEFDLNEDSVDSETMDYILVFIGTMFGVQGASSTLQKLANNLAVRIAKKLPQKALTKGTIYPIVKKIAIATGNRMTKQIFADGIASTMPFIGGVLSGGLTYAMFLPSCMKLRKMLSSYNLCDPEFYNTIDGNAVEVE